MDIAQLQNIETLKKQADQIMPAGVSAAGRFNPSIGRTLFVERGNGARLYAPDGQAYIDYNLAHGACFLGYNHPAIRGAVEAALERGLTAGYETEQTLALAEKIVEIIPCAEKVRLANSGTEGTEAALRLARGFTGRKKIVKFWGHFHGMYDYMMYNVHSPLSPQESGTRIPLRREAAGIAAELDELLIVLPWNDEAALERVIREEGDQIAGIIMEPINYNQGCIVARKPYMEFVRKQATDNGIVLIYDEVLSAFRTGPGCAQAYYGVTPDVCVIAKAVSNGVPLAVIAGKKDFLDHFSPLGGVAHSGTFVGNLISVMAANAALGEITKPGFYEHIYAVADRLYTGLNEIFEKRGIPARVQGLGARFGIYFGITDEVRSFQDTFGYDDKMASRFIRACFERGVYFHSYGKLVRGHHGFSASHTLEDIDETLDRIDTAVLDL